MRGNCSEVTPADGDIVVSLVVRLPAFQKTANVTSRVKDFGGRAFIGKICGGKGEIERYKRNRATDFNTDLQHSNKF